MSMYPMIADQDGKLVYNRELMSEIVNPITGEHIGHVWSFWNPAGFRLSKSFEGIPSLTKQSEADACDINKIMERYAKTGLLDHTNKYQPTYGDATQIGSYQDGIHTVMRAEAMFMELPADVREKFHNDPGKFLDFVSDPNNAQAMYDMGLLTEVGRAAVSDHPPPDKEPSSPVKEEKKDK